MHQNYVLKTTKSSKSSSPRGVALTNRTIIASNTCDNLSMPVELDSVHINEGAEKTRNDGKRQTMS